MSENNQDFQNKLCALAPFKNIQSPPSSPTLKYQSSQTFSNFDQRFPLFKIPQPSHFLQQIKSLRKTTSEHQVPLQPATIESNKKTFTSISSTIDILFSKIERIKEQFSFALTRPHSETQLIQERHPFGNTLYSQKHISVDFVENKQNESVFQLQEWKNDKQKSNQKKRTSYDKGVLSQSPSNGFLHSHEIIQTKNGSLIDYTQQNKSQSMNLFTNWAQYETPKLNIRDFQLGKCIGSGKFGDVYISMHKATGFFCAIKKIFKSTIKEYQMEDQFTNQLKIHYKLNHPNIVKLYSHFEDQYHVFLLLELAPHKSLIDQLKMNSQETAKTIDQVTDALIYLYEQRIIHRDIKPENIVLAFDVPKLCDFGWATFKGNSMHQTFCGTLDYVSPQMKDVGFYSQSVDVWSLGVLTFQLLAGFPPFKQQITNWKMLGSKRKMKWSWQVLFPPEIEGEAQCFIQNLLKIEPNQRLTLRECKYTLFLSQNRNSKLSSQQLNQQFSAFFQWLV